MGYIQKSDQRYFMNNSPQSLFSKDIVLFCLFLPNGDIVWNKLSLSMHIINQTNVGLILCLFISYIISDTIFISTNEAINTANVTSLIGSIEPLSGNNFASWKEKVEV